VLVALRWRMNVMSLPEEEARALGVATGPLPDVWPLQHPVLASLAWALLFMVVFIPLAVRRYQRMGR